MDTPDSTDSTDTTATTTGTTGTTGTDGAARHYDLVIIGAGSGNMMLGEFDHSDWKVAIVDSGRFGGTCLNVGCIPSKILVYTADMADHVREAERFGVSAHVDGIDWTSIQARLWNRIDPIHQSGVDYRRANGIDVYQDHARFVGHKRLQVGAVEITADRFVLAAGARTIVPTIPGLDTVPFHTSDTVMRLPSVPEHLVVLGAGFIACELGHVYAALGAKVTIVTRGPIVLSHEDHDVARYATTQVQRWADLVTEARALAVRGGPDHVELDVDTPDGPRTITGSTLLVAVGRRPNGDDLGVEATGVRLDDAGCVIVDDTNATGVDGIWALGDIVGRTQLKHMANLEARLVAHNLRADAPRALDRRAAPHAVFTTPQIGAVGLTEAAARALGRPICVVTHGYGNTAYGWAMQDDDSFVKLIGDPATRRLLGAHVVGPQAASLVQLLVQGMHLDATVDDLAAGQIYIHPALTEVVEQALLELVKEFDAQL